KRNNATELIPVIFVTALSEFGNEQQGFDLGAVDYIPKPFSPAIVRARVRTHLSLMQVEELRRTRLWAIQCLGQASEYKDHETGSHVMRMSHYSRILAEAAGYDQQSIDDILLAALMHDVGKIGIPDAILQKSGELDVDEWQVMRQHPEIGARIIGDH